jgi:hypothetical protein
MPPEAMRVVVSAFNRSFGSDEGGEGAANPQPSAEAAALNGTGQASTARGAPTV